MATEFKPYPDGGQLFASPTKTNPKSSDYFGEIAINLKDMTAVRVEDGLTIFKLGGWKKVSKSGKTYLSLAVSRYVPKNESPEPQRQQDPDFPEEDLPF
jgi:hypothetical protein